MDHQTEDFRQSLKKALSSKTPVGFQPS